MDDNVKKQISEDLSDWFSTYGLVTVERVFDQLGISLKPHELKQSMEDPTSLFYQILRVPFKNILNGIIINQVQDYREYAQKLFVNYLLSGAANDIFSETTGSDSSEELEELRNTLILMGDECDSQEFEHNKLIAVSQKELLSLIKELNLQNNEGTDTVKNRMSCYELRALELNDVFCQYRTKFYNLILEVRGVLEVIPNYRPDPQQTLENISFLQFDPELGG